MTFLWIDIENELIQAGLSDYKLKLLCISSTHTKNFHLWELEGFAQLKEL